jgi:ribonuclease H2 subunit B
VCFIFDAPLQLLTIITSFTELDEYLKRGEVEATVATGSVKHGKDKKVVTSGENKKRKNTKGSQGVEKLKKANVNGMAKLSSFFNKKP